MTPLDIFAIVCLTLIVFMAGYLLGQHSVKKVQPELNQDDSADWWKRGRNEPEN